MSIDANNVVELKPTAGKPRKAKPVAVRSSQDSESLAAVRRAYEAMADAASMLRVARMAFGDEGDLAVDLADVRRVTVAARDTMKRAFDSLGEVGYPRALMSLADDVKSRLYDTWDITLVLLAAMKQRTPLDGENMSICPLAGTLSVICERLEQHSDELKKAAHG